MLKQYGIVNIHLLYFFQKFGYFPLIFTSDPGQKYVAVFSLFLMAVSQT